MGKTNDHIINHVALVFDRSGSMGGKEKSVIAVADGLVEWLDKRSMSDNHETRVSLYLFDDQVDCPVFDRDVRRLPSLAQHYVIRGGTALIDAGLKVLEDLQKTAQMYGDHAFIAIFVTDGQEIHSKAAAGDLSRAITGLPDNWTVAALVPNNQGVGDAKRFGFPAGNIQIWDTTGFGGVAKVGKVITDGLDSYMTMRSSGGPKSTTGLFTQVANQVTKQAVSASGMKPLDPSKFFLLPAVATGNMTVHIPKRTITLSRPGGTSHVEISEMVRSTGRPYEIGKAFYQLLKSEKWYGNRRIAVIETATAKVFLGDEAKQLVGITDQTRRIKPFPKDKATGKVEFEVFIESHSTNRLLPVGSQLLLLR